MKRALRLLPLFLVFWATAAGQVSINTDGSSPDPSAMLDVKSTSRGLLTPRMTLAQRTAIASPATGLLVYQTDGSAGYYYYSASGWQWLGGSNHTGSGSNGQVTYWTGAASQSGSNNLFWDNTNSRLGIGITTPNQQLELTGNLRIPVTTAGTGIFYSGADPWIHNFGSNNNFLGANCGNLSLAGAQANNAVGDSTLAAVTSGDQNNAIGQGALKAITSGSNNIGIGPWAGKSLTNTTFNTFTGIASGYSATSDRNAFYGGNSGYRTTTGSDNTFLGYTAGYYNVTGSYNTLIGRNAGGSTLTSGTNNTALGYSTNFGAADITNATAIGYNATASASNEMRLGNNSIDALYCMGAYTATNATAPNMYVNSSGQIMRSTATLLSGSGAATRVAFWNGSSSLSSDVNLFWDNTNFRLGIGNATPNQQLELTGCFRFPASTTTAGIFYTDANPWIHNFGTNNNFLGVNSGNLTLAGANNNNALGDSTLTALTTGDNNNAIGQGALKAVTSGSNNIGIGPWAGKSLTSTTYNTFTGFASGYSSSSDRNAFYGSFSGYRTTSGDDNTFVGYTAGYYNVTGGFNTLIGRNAGGATISSGSNNTALGYNSSFSVADITNATAIGNGATASASNEMRLGNSSVDALYCMGAYSATSATAPNMYVDATGKIMRSTATLLSGSGTATRVAFWSGTSSLSSDANLYWDNTNNRLGVGTAAPAQQLELTGNLRLPASTATAGIIYSGTARYLHNYGTGNNFLGTASGNLTLTTASYNNCVGDSTLYSLSDGNSNIAIGNRAGRSLVTGSKNVMIGDNAGDQVNSTISNILIGSNTGRKCAFLGFFTQTGSDNIMVGEGSGSENTSGQSNTFLGSTSGTSNTTGNGNIFMGCFAGNSNVTGTENVVIGYSADLSSSNLHSAIAIGAFAEVNASNKAVIGGPSVTTIGGYGAWSNYSDKRLKENIRYTTGPGLDFIMKLKTVSYNYRADKNKRRRDGLIAQDVQQAMEETGSEFSGLVIDDDPEKTLNLSYSEFVIPLINAMKEQQEMVRKLQKENAALRERVEALENKQTK